MATHKAQIHHELGGGGINGVFVQCRVRLDLDVALIGGRLSGEGVPNNACTHYEILWPLMTTSLNSGVVWRGNRFVVLYPIKVSTQDTDVQ